MIKQVPTTIFKTRIKNASGEFQWQDLKTHDIFSEKKIIIFSLPGAFTPTCSSTHLPGYEENYQKFLDLGVDEIYCLSVNDAFVMNAWAKIQDVEKVKMLPDGNGDFTKGMNMLVKKENLGFGDRSWRYSMLVNNGEIKKMFIEEGKSDNFSEDPFLVSDAGTMLKYLESE
jgi:thioredoxin-dependent peroxiredoxin